MKPALVKPSKLSPSTLGAHDKSTSTRKHSRQHFVSSWITSQTEMTVDEAGPSCTASTDSQTQILVPKPQRRLQVATPAITLTTPDQGEAESTEIMPIQRCSVSLSATPLPFDRLALPITAPWTATDNVGTPPRQPHLTSHGASGVGARRVSIYPNMNLANEPIVEEVDEPIVEEVDEPIVEEVEEDSKEDKFYISSEEEELAAEVVTVNQKIHIDDPIERSNSSRIRSRALSYPVDTHPRAPPFPLVELPQHSQTDVSAKPESEIMESSMTQQPEQPASTVGKFVHVAIMAKKWKHRSTHGEVISVQQQSVKEAQKTRQKQRPYTEVPRVLKLELLEEAYPIVQNTFHMYKSQLGPRHKLTLLAEKHLRDLASKLGRQTS